MKKNVTILLCAAILLFAGCNTADQKAPQIAADFCNCFSDVEKGLSAKTKQIWEAASNSDDPTKKIQEEMEKLSEEEKQTVSTEMSSFSEMSDPNSKVGRCMKDIEKKYGDAKTFNEDKFLNSLIKELDKKQGCSFTAAVFKIGMKAKGKKVE